MRKFILILPVILLFIGGVGNKHKQEQKSENLSFQNSNTTPFESSNNAIIDYKNKEELDVYLSSLPEADYSPDGDYEEVPPNWVSRGPVNVGGRTRALAVDIRNDNIILAGSTTGGLWRSENGGDSWEMVSSINEGLGIRCLAQDPRPNHKDTWYYGTGENIGLAAASGIMGLSYGYKGSGIYYSRDNGVSWQSFRNDLFNNHTYIHDIGVDPNSGKLIVASDYGISEVSTDNERALLERKKPGNMSYVGDFRHVTTDVEVLETGEAFASFAYPEGEDSKRNIYYRNAAGEWSDITPDISTGDRFNLPSYISRIEIGSSTIIRNNRKAYFFMEVIEEEENDSFHFSTMLYVCNTTYDEGQPEFRWEDRSTNLPNEDLLGGSQYKLCVKVKPDNPNFVLLGGTHLMRSTDGFSTDRNISQLNNGRRGSLHVDIHSVVFSSRNNSKVFVGCDGGVYKTQNISSRVVGDNGLVWENLNDGYVTAQPYSITFPESTRSSMIAVGLQDNGTQMSFEESSEYLWNRVAWADGLHSEFSNNGHYLLSSNQSGSITVHGINNATEEIINERTIRTGFSWGTGAFFQLDPNIEGMTYIADSTSRIRRYNNIFREDRFTNLPELNLGGSKIYTLEISKRPANILYVGLESNKVFKVANANTRNPEITDITEYDMPKMRGSVSCIKTDPLNADRVFVTYKSPNSRNIFYSKDGGDNWHDITGNLIQNIDGGNLISPSIRWIEVHRLDSRPGYVKILLATDNGLFSTEDLTLTDDEELAIQHTISWSREAGSLIGSKTVTRVESRAIDGKVIASVYGSGVVSAYMGRDNQPPVQTQSLGEITLVSGSGLNIDLSNYFSDNDNDPISFSGLNNAFDERVASYSINRDQLSITPTGVGTTYLTVCATTPDRMIAEGALKINVISSLGLLYGQAESSMEFYASSINRIPGQGDEIIELQDNFEIPNGATWRVNKFKVYGKREMRSVSPERVRISLEKQEGDGRVEVFSENYSEEDRNFSILTGAENKMDFHLSFDRPLELGSGHYWLRVTPVILESNRKWLWQGESSGGTALENRNGRTVATRRNLKFEVLGDLAGNTYNSPSELVANQLDENSTRLTWDLPVQERNVEPLGVLVERALLHGDISFRSLVILPYGTEEFTDYSNLEPGEVYRYRIKVVGQRPDSRYTNESRVHFKGLPISPDGFRILSMTSTTAIINWESIIRPSWQEAHEGYKVYRSLYSGSRFELIGEVDPNLWVYADNRVPQEGTRYFYKISTYNEIGESFSNTVNRMSQLYKPTHLTATKSSNDVILVWEDNSRKETNYKVLRAPTREAAHSGNWEEIAVLDADAERFVDKKVLMGIHQDDFHYRVIAYNKKVESEPSHISKARQNNGIVGGKSGNKRMGDKSLAENDLKPDHHNLEMNIFPDPVISKLNLKVNRKDGEKGNVHPNEHVIWELFDLKGNMISGNTELMINDALEVDISSAKTGSYIFVLRTGDHTTYEKMIVKK